MPLSSPGKQKHESVVTGRKCEEFIFHTLKILVKFKYRRQRGICFLRFFYFYAIHAEIDNNGLNCFKLENGERKVHFSHDSRILKHDLIAITTIPLINLTHDLVTFFPHFFILSYLLGGLLHSYPNIYFGLNI